ncbi:autotransporter serine protease [Brevundimonas kwangchunensis]|uniref:Autotransporter serine protease n=1 Tax=Brevundimonas kwangchunensis TaxID=322163 RepID=A0ABN1GLG0_9CAUL
MPALSMSRRQSLMYASALGAIAVFGAAPASAQEVSGAEQIAATLHHGGLREERHVDFGPLAYTPPVAGAVRLPPAGYVEPGRVGDVASWMTPEFMQDYGLRQMNAQYAYARGLTGAGIRAGVLDDGVEFRHTEFTGKNNLSITAADVLADGSLCAPTNGVMNLTGCFYTQGDESARDFYVYDGNDIYTGLLPTYVGVSGNRFMYRTGHGTHVAGTIAGNRDENGTHGVGYNASIVSARLFADSISDLDSLVYEAAGLNCPAGACYSQMPQMSLQARTNVYRDFVASGVKVINNSWGYTLRTPTVANLDAAYLANKAFLDPIFLATAQQTSAAGILQVWSAGNTPNDVAGLTASLPRWMPEYEPYWVAVANINSAGTINAGSSICGAAAQWCVAAAGTTIWSAQFGTNAVFSNAGGTTLAGHEIIFNDLGQPIGFREIATGEITTNAFKTLTGTSMAAPHVTGALTLLFERYPYLQGTFVRDIMLTTARDIGAPGVDPIYGWGIVDLQKAINGPGQLIKDSTVNMTNRAGGAKVWTGDAWDDWSNDISGVGRLTKTGQGWLRLSGSNTFNGLTVQQGVLELTGANALTRAVDVTGGTLMIGGTLNNTPLNVTGGSAIVTGTINGGLTTIGAAGSLFGTGTLANTIVSGSITPGLSVTDLGRLNVIGSYVQNAGSTFNVATRPANSSGLLAVTGAATLNGGTVNVLALPGLYQVGQTYTILTATGGVTGGFSGVQTNGLTLPFMSFSLTPSANAVRLTVSRGMAFSAAATTDNMRSVGGAIDALPTNNVVLNSLSQLTLEQGRTALTEISGEAYASIQGSLIDSGRSVREAAISRIVAGANRPEVGISVWGDARRSEGERTGYGVARAEQTTDTYLIGADFGLSNNLTFGVFGGWGETEVQTTAASNIDADNSHFGLYGAYRGSNWRVGGGVVYSDHNADVRRSITTPGLGQQLRSETDYSTQQYFVDLGFPGVANGTTAEPFLQLVHLRSTNDGVVEAGGNLALTGEVAEADMNIATAGVRFASSSANLPMNLQLRGAMGFRVVDGDLAPSAQFAFPGSNAFVVGGAPRSDKAFVVDGGLAAEVARNVSLEVGYSGELGSKYDNHTGNVRLVVNF